MYSYLKLLVLIMIFIFSSASIIGKYKNQKLYRIFKPIPLIIMIVFYTIHLIYYQQINLFNIFILIGLCFALAGDIFISLDNLISGIILFLVCHILYILYFIQIKYNLNIIFVIPIVSFAICFGFFIYIKMNDVNRKKFFIPVVFYIIVITTMLIFAINFDNNLQTRASIPFFIIGAFLFYISDAILALLTFIKKFPSDHLLNLSTYYLAQIFITLGAIDLMV
ncbi:MAG: lysoplasmalogenase [Spirochaetes bacterium]|nr:lysoplasmalogenase [Spirochaetota bacterium]